MKYAGPAKRLDVSAEMRVSEIKFSDSSCPVSVFFPASCPVLLNREERESISSLVSVADVTMLYSPAIPQGLVWSKCRTKKQTF